MFLGKIGESGPREFSWEVKEIPDEWQWGRSRWVGESPPPSIVTDIGKRNKKWYQNKQINNYRQRSHDRGQSCKYVEMGESAAETPALV